MIFNLERSSKKTFSPSKKPIQRSPSKVGKSPRGPSPPPLAVDDKHQPVFNKFIQAPKTSKLAQSRRPSVGPNVGAHAGRFLSEKEANAQTNSVSDCNGLRKRNDSVD